MSMSSLPVEIFLGVVDYIVFPADLHRLRSSCKVFRDCSPSKVKLSPTRYREKVAELKNTPHELQLLNFESFSDLEQGDVGFFLVVTDLEFLREMPSATFQQRFPWIVDAFLTMLSRNSAQAIRESLGDDSPDLLIEAALCFADVAICSSLLEEFMTDSFGDITLIRFMGRAFLRSGRNVSTKLIDALIAFGGRITPAVLFHVVTVGANLRHFIHTVRHGMDIPIVPLGDILDNIRHSRLDVIEYILQLHPARDSILADTRFTLLAAESDDLASFKKLVKLGLAVDPTSCLLHTSSLAVIRHLISSFSVNINERIGDDSLLSRAVQTENFPFLRDVLKIGVEVSGVNGGFALLQAIRSMSWSVSPLRLLLRAGADVNTLIGSEQRTVFHWAIHEIANPEVIQLLVKSGANVNQPDSNGTTPLMVAVTNNMLACVNILMNAGALINLVDYDGETAISIAEGVGNLAICKLLRSDLQTHAPKRRRKQEYLV